MNAKTLDDLVKDNPEFVVPDRGYLAVQVPKKNF